MQQNSLSKIFLRFYLAVKADMHNDELKRFINYSFLKIYLLAKGREPYKKVNISTINRILFSIKEYFLAKRRLNKVLKNKSFNSIIVINESSHLKHALPLKAEIKPFNPLFITNKKRYINDIEAGFNTTNVVFIPKTIIKSSKFKSIEVRSILSQFEIETVYTDDIVEMLNESYNNYTLIKKFIETITNNNNIKFMYGFNDLLFTGRVITDICNQKGIKTYYLMHGLLSNEFIENLHISNYYLIFGDYIRNVLVDKEGITNDKVITIGAPYLREQLKAKQADFFEKEITAQLPKNKRIALVLLSGAGHTVSPQHHKAIISLLKELIQDKNNNYFFVFKLHGKDVIGNYTEIIEGEITKKSSRIYPFNYLQNKETIFDWIKLADVILTGASTTALEAMYMGKPVITIDLMNEFENTVDFIKQGATYHCNTKQTVNNIMDMLLTNNFGITEESKEIVNQYFADFSNIQNFHTNILLHQIAN